MKKFYIIFYKFTNNNEKIYIEFVISINIIMIMIFKKNRCLFHLISDIYK